MQPCALAMKTNSTEATKGIEEAFVFLAAPHSFSTCTVGLKPRHRVNGNNHTQPPRRPESVPICVVGLEQRMRESNPTRLGWPQPCPALLQETTPLIPTPHFRQKYVPPSLLSFLQGSYPRSWHPMPLPPHSRSFSFALSPGLVLPSGGDNSPRH